MIFDTHCHGYWRGLAHRQDEVRRNMQSAGVVRSVHIGTDLARSRDSLALARQWGAGTWCTAGFHPTGCQDQTWDSAPGYMEQLEKLAQSNRDKVVGIGETGLDYFHTTRDKKEAQKKVQQAFFRAHAALALRLDLPLIIHTRDAAADTIALIREFGIKRAVIHCFSENEAFARELMAWSSEIYFSFSGILTYKRSVAVQDAARSLPLDRILVETDAPFLVPQAVREAFSTNEPAFTKHVMDSLKALRNEPEEVVEQTVWQNSNRFYKIAD
jgi:TatD DNase family protein